MSRFKFTCYYCKREQTKEEVKLYFELCAPCWREFTGKDTQTVDIAATLERIANSGKEP